MNRLLLIAVGPGLGVLLSAGVAPDDPRSTATTDGVGSPLVLRLSAPQNELRMGERPTVKITITSKHGKSVTLVEPGDGSESGWRTPIVGWSVVRVKVAGRAKHPADLPVAKVFRCGNINRLKRNEVLVLEPNGSKHLGEWAGSPAFPGPGTYSVVFYYSNEPDLAWKGIPLGRHDPEAMGQVRKSFKCALRSNEIRFVVKEK